MRTLDIKLYETGNGGDFQILGNDLEAVAGFDNMPYMYLFGANLTDTGDSDEQRLDWWGNRLILEPPARAVSITERRLQEFPLTSQGRQIIENAVRTDIEAMRAFCNVRVSVRIISDDVLTILIELARPDSLQNKQFQFIWDATLGQVRGIDTGYTPPEDVTLRTDARITDAGVSRITGAGLNRLIS
jgi:hypothetical protein